MSDSHKVPLPTHPMDRKLFAMPVTRLSCVRQSESPTSHTPHGQKALGNAGHQAELCEQSKHLCCSSWGQFDYDLGEVLPSLLRCRVLVHQHGHLSDHVTGVSGRQPWTVGRLSNLQSLGRQERRHAELFTMMVMMMMMMHACSTDNCILLYLSNCISVSYS